MCRQASAIVNGNAARDRDNRQAALRCNAVEMCRRYLALNRTVETHEHERCWFAGIVLGAARCPHKDHRQEKYQTPNACESPRRQKRSATRYRMFKFRVDVTHRPDVVASPRRGPDLPDACNADCRVHDLQPSVLRRRVPARRPRTAWQPRRVPPQPTSRCLQGGGLFDQPIRQAHVVGGCVRSRRGWSSTVVRA